MEWLVAISTKMSMHEERKRQLLAVFRSPWIFTRERICERTGEQIDDSHVSRVTKESLETIQDIL